ncbi:hypothetical protein ACP70R_022513 [Stipagrostis hirtigluma subsp. patula]
MAQRNQGTTATSLSKRKDAANGASTTMIRQADESNSVMSGMEALSGQGMNGKAVQQKETLTDQMEATMKQEPRKEKRKKQKTMQSPILAAVLKFHKDDDMDPRPPTTGDAVAAA